MTESEIYNQLSHIYGDVIPSHRYLKLHIVYEGGGELDLHDRFFLTMHGSINFGRGYRFRKGFENKVKTINL
jgi:hypothetical protein